MGSPHLGSGGQRCGRARGGKGFRVPEAEATGPGSLRPRPTHLGESFWKPCRGCIEAPSHLAMLLTWARKAPHFWGGGPRAMGTAPGDSVSRHPCSGGPLGQVLSRGGVPGPGGIVLLIGVALGEIGRDLGPVQPHWSLALLQTPLPDPPGVTLGSPTSWHPDSVPPALPCCQYQCRSAPRPPHGHSCAVPMPQRGSRSARSQSLCSARHPARWARSQGHSGFCPRGAGFVHSPAPSRPRCRPAGPSCHRTLSPSVQHATPPADRHTGWVRQPAEP